MKMNSILCTVLLTPVVTVAWADINLGRPTPAGGAVEHQQGIYHSELLASNTVRAVFKGLRSIPVVDLATPTPATQEVAVFEVRQNLKHLRYDRMGDGAMNAGKLFPVSLAADVPGQDAALGDTIRELKPGDEVILVMDHIYLYRESGNESVRAVTRFAEIPSKQADTTPPANAQGDTSPAPSDSNPETVPPAPLTPAAPAPDVKDAPDNAAPDPTEDMSPTPLTPESEGYARSVETHYTVEPDGKGGYRRTTVKITREWDQASGKEIIHKYINGTEVDPQTDKPVTQPTANPAPTQQF